MGAQLLPATNQRRHRLEDGGFVGMTASMTMSSSTCSKITHGNGATRMGNGRSCRNDTRLLFQRRRRNLVLGPGREVMC